jgi:DNA-binding transcriptional ArsR family regulator
MQSRLDASMRIELSGVDYEAAPQDTEHMKEGPDISRLAALLGDPARANILQALMSGKALTAGELADEAGVTPATTSSHLQQLLDADLLWVRKQGRHRYFALKDEDVAYAIEALGYLSAAKGGLRTRTGPKDLQMREARVCYDHMAGGRAVQIYDTMARRSFLEIDHEAVTLSAEGESFVEQFGIDVAAIRTKRRPLCRMCLDWSERRTHLAGALGAAMLTRFLELNWIRREKDSRTIRYTPEGDRAYKQLFEPRL